MGFQLPDPLGIASGQVTALIKEHAQLAATDFFKGFTCPWEDVFTNAVPNHIEHIGAFTEVSYNFV